MGTHDMYSEIVFQLEKLCETEASTSRLEWFKLQHKEQGLKSYGLRTPAVRKLIKRYKSRFKQLHLEDKFALAKMFYESNFIEQAAVGDMLLELSGESLTPNHFALLDEVASSFNNWASVDSFCLHVLQSVLLKHRSEVLKLLRKWNRSDSKWKRRASVVAFVWKIGANGEFTDEVLEFCENLIWDKEDLVLKGVGWALRDNMPGAKKRVIEYVISLRRRGVSSKVTLYAIENLNDKERKEVLKIKPE